MTTSTGKFVCAMMIFAFAAVTLFRVMAADDHPQETPAGVSGVEWSEIISADTIVNQIKATQQALDKDWPKGEEFSAADCKRCRAHFARLAVLFAVAGQIDKDISWKDQAPLGRDLFACVAANLKVNTKATFDEAKQRKADLDAILAGKPIALKIKAEPEVDWEKVCDRTQLMSLMNSTLEERLTKIMEKKAGFVEQRQALKNESEMIALVATILAQPGMKDQEDAIYSAHADSLKRAAEAFGQVAERKDFDAALPALKLIGQSCSNCHEEFR